MGSNRVEFFLQFVKKYPQFKNSLGYEKINELRLLVNYTKHGVGPSEKELRKKRPDYFWQGVSYDYSKPLSGYEVKIEKNDFLSYIKAIKSFVEEIRVQWGREIGRHDI